MVVGVVAAVADIVAVEAVDVVATEAALPGGITSPSAVAAGKHLVNPRHLPLACMVRFKREREKSISKAYPVEYYNGKGNCGLWRIMENRCSTACA